MSMAQHQQLYKLQKKATLIKGKKTPESSKASEVRMARAYLQVKIPKLITEIIQPLTEREAEPESAMQTLDRQGYQQGTVSPVR